MVRPFRSRNTRKTRKTRNVAFEFFRVFCVVGGFAAVNRFAHRVPDIPNGWINRRMAILPGHGSDYGMEAKYARLQIEPKTNPFIDRAGYHAYVDDRARAFREALKKQ
jgi:hypothetical protein